MDDYPSLEINEGITNIYEAERPKSEKDVQKYMNGFQVDTTIRTY